MRFLVHAFFCLDIQPYVSDNMQWQMKRVLLLILAFVVVKAVWVGIATRHHGGFASEKDCIIENNIFAVLSCSILN